MYNHRAVGTILNLLLLCSGVFYLPHFVFSMMYLWLVRPAEYRNVFDWSSRKGEVQFWDGVGDWSEFRRANPNIEPKDVRVTAPFMNSLINRGLLATLMLGISLLFYGGSIVIIILSIATDMSDTLFNVLMPLYWAGVIIALLPLGSIISVIIIRSYRRPLRLGGYDLGGFFLDMKDLQMADPFLRWFSKCIGYGCLLDITFARLSAIFLSSPSGVENTILYYLLLPVDLIFRLAEYLTPSQLVAASTLIVLAFAPIFLLVFMIYASSPLLFSLAFFILVLPGLARLVMSDARIDISNADIRNATIIGELPDSLTCVGTRFNLQTYINSGWNPIVFRFLLRKGADPGQLSEYPPEATDHLDGIVISMYGDLTQRDRFVLESILEGARREGNQVVIKDVIKTPQLSWVRLTGTIEGLNVVLEQFRYMTHSGIDSALWSNSHGDTLLMNEHLNALRSFMLHIRDIEALGVTSLGTAGSGGASFSPSVSDDARGHDVDTPTFRTQNYPDARAARIHQLVRTLYTQLSAVELVKVAEIVGNDVQNHIPRPPSPAATIAFSIVEEILRRALPFELLADAVVLVVKARDASPTRKQW